MDINISVKELIAEGWQLTKQHFVTLLGLGVVVTLVMMVPQLVIELIPEEMGLLSLVLTLVVSIVQVMISLNVYRVMLKLTNGETVSVSMLFELESKKLISYYVASILIGLMVFFGLLLLIIPGIYLSMVYSQAMILIADKGMGARQSMRESKVMMKGNVGKYLSLGFALLGVNILGLLALGIGVIVTIMISQFATILFYKKLSTMVGEGQGGQLPTGGNGQVAGWPTNQPAIPGVSTVPVVTETNQPSITSQYSYPTQSTAGDVRV